MSTQPIRRLLVISRPLGLCNILLVAADDRSSVFQNRFRNRWVFSIKTDPEMQGSVGLGSRGRGYWESESMFGPTWTEKRAGLAAGAPAVWQTADTHDPRMLSDPPFPPQVYNIDGANYESVVIGLFSILRCKHGDDARCPGPVSPHAIRRRFDLRVDLERLLAISGGWTRDQLCFPRVQQRRFSYVSTGQPTSPVRPAESHWLQQLGWMHSLELRQVHKQLLVICRPSLTDCL